jgi:hypothetical protein
VSTGKANEARVAATGSAGGFLVGEDVVDNALAGYDPMMWMAATDGTFLYLQQISLLTPLFFLFLSS